MTNYPSTRERGAAMILFVLFFLFASASMGYILAKGIISNVGNQRILERSKQSYLTSLSANEDILYRYKNAKTPDATEVVTLGGASATTTTVIDGSTGKYTITTTAEKSQARRLSKMTLTVVPGISFSFGMQSGQGGILLENSASVLGNVYSNGPIVGQNTAMVKGDATSAGPSGSFDGLTATGTVRAHSILSSPSIGKDAYYQSINNGATTVLGTKYPGSPDMATTSLPISDSTISSWETEAAAGGTYSGPCPYKPNTNVTLGPIKIPCDFEFDANGKTLTVNGPIWVTGTMVLTKGTIQVGSAMADKVVPIIADKASNRTTSSWVTIANTMSFTSATGDSYSIIISMNKSGETGGSNDAIEIKNSAAGEVLLYAPHGILAIENNTNLRQATAWRIHGKNSSQVQYKTGLLDPSFTSGPAGTFTVSKWDEIY